ncbi:cuticle protein 10.9-like [Uloborus diversus]|uniref:cuticle protein 10.9-like n=1 Tax=Uloborus diversus TaxID=327109 RepID=UPI0024099FDF|nr:cuticle protein 10.9-like [Uloborus diversus]
MKFLVIFFAVLAMAAAQSYKPEEYPPQPYSFSYKAEGDEGSSSHEENSDGAGTVRGSYTVTDIDGRNRVVEYIADAAGFRATVRTNEPGTDNGAPANVIFESTAPDAKGPIIRYSGETNAISRAPEATVVNTGRQGQNVRYVLVPSTDPRARGYN